MGFIQMDFLGIQAPNIDSAKMGCWVTNEEIPSN